MRDTYVEIPKHKTQKINAAYQMGGPELLMKTIEMNFRIKLDKYIIVNFWGFEDIIDSVGGIEVDIKEHEINEINKYIGETREIKSPPLLYTGYQELDGQQALAYARIRKTDSEYNRTERQREVLGLLVQKLKATSIINYPKVMESMLGCVRTNIEPASLLNYAYTVSQFNPMEVVQLQMPMTDLSWGGMYNGAWVLLMDKNQNAKVMNDFIFTNKTVTKEELDMKAFKIALDDYFAKAIKVEHANEDPSLDTPSKDSEKQVDDTDKDATKNDSDKNTNAPETEEGKTETGEPVNEAPGTDGTKNPGTGTNGGTTDTGTGTGSSGSTGSGTGTGNTGTDNVNTGTSGTGSASEGTNTSTTGTNEGSTSGSGNTSTGSATTGNTNTGSGNAQTNNTNTTDKTTN
jgi:LCP family protein required for cell wall assembly